MQRFHKDAEMFERKLSLGYKGPVFFFPLEGNVRRNGF